LNKPFIFRVDRVCLVNLFSVGKPKSVGLVKPKVKRLFGLVVLKYENFGMEECLRSGWNWIKSAVGSVWVVSESVGCSGSVLSPAEGFGNEK
jgi:hypothetical protein